MFFELSTPLQNRYTRQCLLCYVNITIFVIFKKGENPMRSHIVYCFVLCLIALCVGCNAQAVPSGGDATIPVTNNPQDFYREGFPTELTEIEASLAERYSVPKTDDFVQFLKMGYPVCSSSVKINR